MRFERFKEVIIKGLDVVNPLRYRADFDSKLVLDPNASYLTGLKWNIKISLRDIKLAMPPTESLMNRQIGRI